MWRRRLARRFRALVRRTDVERELAEEFRFHIEQESAELMAQFHLSPDEARRRALIAFGGLEKWRESHYDARGTRWLEDSWRDVTLGFRSLRRNKGFATAVVLTLALGIGANTAMFTVLRGTLLRPLPNRDGSRLLYLRQSAPAADRHDVGFSVPEVADYRAGTRTLAQLAEYSTAVPFTIVTGDGAPARVHVAVVSGNFFDVMGLVPVLGRVTNARDDGAAAASVAVLSYEYWMDHFGGDPGIVGRTVRINEKISTVVGVVERTPQYPDPTDLFVNTVTSPHHLSATMVTDRSHRMSELFARLAPTATVEQARLEIGRIASNLFRDHPEAYEKAAQYQVTVSPLRDAVNERASLMFWLLMGAAAFVLLIACANVANLTLMRGVGREREMLVRAALGAGRGRLRRLLIVENLTLATIGGAIGVLVALAGLKLLVAFAAQFSPRAYEIRIDALVLAVSLVTTVAVAIALSFVPRVGGERSLGSSLAPAGRVTLGRGRQRLQRSLVVAQIAVCMVLLTGAGLLVRTLTKLDSVNTGVRTDHVLTVDLPLGGDLLRELMNQPENLARYERIRDRVAALPGVDMASLATTAPLRNSMIGFDLKAEGHPTPPNRPTPHAGMKTIDPNYFTTAGIPLLAGRAFASTDGRGTAPVVVLNQSFAKQLFGDDDPVGRRIAWVGEVLKYSPFTADWRTVVGVVGDTRDRGLDSDPAPTVYLPFAQEVIINAALVVRTSSDPDVLKPAVLGAIHEIAPRQMIERVATIDQIRDEAVAPRRLNAMFIVAFGALAFGIAMVGIAGVLAFSVSLRTAEIGIRMSFGADAARVRRMILGEGGVLLVAGVLVGSAGALLAARLLRGLLFGVTPHDPATLGIVAFMLSLVGIAACWIPAARAARVDPAVALRAE